MVANRETYDSCTNELIESLDNLHDRTNAELYAAIPEAPRDITTVLYYYSASGRGATWPDSAGPSQSVEAPPANTEVQAEMPRASASAMDESREWHVPGDTDDEGQDTNRVARKTEAELRAEAVSIPHLLSHLPKNPFCDACCRAKAQKGLPGGVSTPLLIGNGRSSPLQARNLQSYRLAIT